MVVIVIVTVTVIVIAIALALVGRKMCVVRRKYCRLSKSVYGWIHERLSHGKRYKRLNFSLTLKV